MDEKSIKNHSKNQPKNGVPHRTVATKTGVPHRPKLGYPIGHCGTGSWDALRGVLRAILDRFGAVLEASWAVLGRERWPTWDQLGVQNGAKID